MTDDVQRVTQYLKRKELTREEASVPRVAGSTMTHPETVREVLSDDDAETAETDPSVEPVQRPETPGVSGRDVPVVDVHSRAREGVDDRPLEDRAMDCFESAVDYFHEQLDAEIDAHAGTDRPSTARDYFDGVRGWTGDTIDDRLLGWAPPDRSVITHLREMGFADDALRATGLFTSDLSKPLWMGRYVMPYLSDTGAPVFAISRTTGDRGGGAAGYDGHPVDFMSGKYAKPATTRDATVVTEPIYGLDTVEPGDTVVVTEGIADAITAAEAGHATLSPVTVRFKHDDREALAAVLSENAVDDVVVINDAERPTSSVTDDGDLELTQVPPGLDGALTTAAMIDAETDTRARVGTLPRPGLRKVDVDDYLGGWSDDLEAVIASAKPADHFAEFAPETDADPDAVNVDVGEVDSDDADQSGLWSLTVTDVLGVPAGYRGKSPLAHTGNSENYFVVGETGETATDHKRGVGYNALTALAVQAGCRTVDRPSGSLTDIEVWRVWEHAKREGPLPGDDRAPYRAVRGYALANLDVSREDLDTSGDYARLPAGVYSRAVEDLEAMGLETGRTDDLAANAYSDAKLRDLTNGELTDPSAMMVACIAAREEGRVTSTARPPRLAIVPILVDVCGVSPVGASEATVDMARDIYHDLEGVDDAREMVDRDLPEVVDGE